MFGVVVGKAFGWTRDKTKQELADLMSYLALDKPPDDPSAKFLPGAPVPKK